MTCAEAKEKYLHEEVNESDRDRDGYWVEAIQPKDTIISSKFVDDYHFTPADYIKIDDVTDEQPTEISKQVKKLEEFTYSEKYKELDEKERVNYILQLKHLKGYNTRIWWSTSKPFRFDKLTFSDALELMEHSMICCIDNNTPIVYFYNNTKWFNKQKSTGETLYMDDNIYTFNTKTNTFAPWIPSFEEVSSNRWMLATSGNMPSGSYYDDVVKKINIFRHILDK